MRSTRRRDGSCHPAAVGSKRRWRRAGAPRRAAALGLLLALALHAHGCASTASPAPWLAPIGHFDVTVGTAWIWPLRHDGGTPPLFFELVEAPASVELRIDGDDATLLWLPTVFDLAQTPPGQARATGPARPVAVRLRDGEGRSAEARGTLRAVPAPDKR